MIEDYGGKDVRFDATENTINFKMADGTSVSFCSAEVDDYDCVYDDKYNYDHDDGLHLISSILVKDVDPNICPVVHVVAKPENMAFAADGYFYSSKAGAETLRYFLSVDAKNIDDRINMTKKHIKEEEEE